MQDNYALAKLPDPLLWNGVWPCETNLVKCIPLTSAHLLNLRVVARGTLDICTYSTMCACGISSQRTKHVNVAVGNWSYYQHKPVWVWQIQVHS